MVDPWGAVARAAFLAGSFRVNRTAMIRAVLLAIGKEFRLLRRDPVGLFMLVVAPIAVIAAAGFSLSRVYGGGSSSYAVAVVDEDDGEISRAVVEALRSKPSLIVLHVDNRDLARAMVREHKQAIVAIIIPAGTTAAFEHGASVRLLVYADPVRYLETVNVELELAHLGRRINQAANDRARQALAEARERLEREIADANHGADQARAAIAQFARTAQHTRAELDAQVRSQLETAVASARAQTEEALNSAITELSSKAQSQVASQRALLGQTRDYLERLKTTRVAFERWLADLQHLAGSRASSIPAPPAFPEPPPDLLTIGDSEPTAPNFGALRARLKKSIATPDLNVHIPGLAFPPLPAIPALPTEASK